MTVWSCRKSYTQRHCGCIQIGIYLFTLTTKNSNLKTPVLAPGMEVGLYMKKDYSRRAVISRLGAVSAGVLLNQRFSYAEMLAPVAERVAKASIAKSPVGMDVTITAVTDSTLRISVAAVGESTPPPEACITLSGGAPAKCGKLLLTGRYHL